MLLDESCNSAAKIRENFWTIVTIVTGTLKSAGLTEAGAGAHSSTPAGRTAAAWP
jgi:hypothetical protein